MPAIKRILLVLLLALFVIFGLTFGSLNRESVPIDYLFFTLEWPLAASMLVFLIGGALLGGLVTWLGTWVAVRRRIAVARAEQRVAEQARADAEASVEALPSTSARLSHDAADA